MHFSISLFCTFSEILWKTLAIFSKLSYNAFQPRTTVSLYVKQQILQNTSRKLFSVLGKMLIWNNKKLHVGRWQLCWELHCRFRRGNFPKRLKQCPQLFVFANLSITIKSTPFAGKKYRVSYFFKKKETRRVNSCLTYCSQKRKIEKRKKMKKWITNITRC